MERVAVYYVEKINKEHSCNLDLRKIGNFCIENNYDYCLYVDIVKSRKIINNRKELKKLKKDIENRVYSKIIILNLSNISRNIDFNLELIRFAESYNCKIISTDKFDPHQYKNFIDNVYKKINDDKER
ncbi:MAG: recombinase family protein [Bacilli bacterium]|nr:recombinase family protein [Bacilli bacterium]